MRRALIAALSFAALAAALPASASAAIFGLDGSFGSGIRPEGRFADPAGIATDDAGRVYVADTGSGRIEVFDSGEFGNVYLGSVGEGTLGSPVGVAVDLRNRIFVADPGRDKVVQFDRFRIGGPFMRDWGGSGTELGKMSGPRMVAPDLTGLAYNTEGANARVQWFAPKEGQMTALGAFGTADPPGFDNPEGLTLDTGAGQIYVTNNSPSEGGVRVYDLRGFMLGQLAGPGGEPGKVSAPRGIEIDPFGRVVVADTGNNRLQVWSSFASGGEFKEAYSGSELGGPVDMAFGPGALLYVTDAASGRVLRYRYDDADADSVLDPRDNCAGLSNAEQSDIDRDGSGDACDDDDDGDGLADASDACPASKRGPDLNRDGCADPTSTVGGAQRARGARVARFTGTARADRRLGLARVEVAIARLAGSRCSWYAGGRRFTAPRSCSQLLWVRAKGTSRWIAAVKTRRAGSYRVRSRAVQEGGVVEVRATARNSRTFRLR